jgi:hypothetical protein
MTQELLWSKPHFTNIPVPSSQFTRFPEQLSLRPPWGMKYTFLQGSSLTFTIHFKYIPPRLQMSQTASKNTSPSIQKISRLNSSARFEAKACVAHLFDGYLFDLRFASVGILGYPPTSESWSQRQRQFLCLQMCSLPCSSSVSQAIVDEVSCLLMIWLG